MAHLDAEALKLLDKEKLREILEMETRKYINAIKTHASEKEVMEKRETVQMLAALLDSKMMNPE